MQLIETLSLLRATLESTADGILVTAPDGRIVTFNERFLAIWGLPRESVEGAVVLAEHAFHRGEEVHGPQMRQRGRELLLGREVVEERLPRDAGALADIGDGRLRDPALAEERTGGRHDARRRLATATGVTIESSRRRCG